MKPAGKLFSLFLVAITGVIVFYACSKNDSVENVIPPGKQQLSLYLTDGPDIFDEVNIDIKSVKVLVDTCDKTRGYRNWDHDKDDSCLVWDSLDIAPGVYDLLTLRNGVDTLFATGVIPEGRIKKIKIELGTNHSLVKDSVTYPLNFPPGWSPTITLKLFGHECDEYRPGHLRLWLDFDINRSIIRVRNGLFWLKPVIHMFILKTTGSIEGRVLPDDANSVITVYNDMDTAYALPFRNGKFKVRGLEEGDYSVFINAGNGYQDTTITGVSVEKGKETKLETITLHK